MVLLKGCRESAWVSFELECLLCALCLESACHWMIEDDLCDEG